MKRIYIYLLVVVVAFSITACDDMMDVHKKYIENGEIVYAPNIDSLVFYAGQNKVYFKFWTFNAINVKSVDLYWDEDSLITLVNPSSELDSIMISVPCEEEKSYTFKVRTTDVFGNHSLWNTGFANSYGAFFKESLSNRMLKGFIIKDNDAIITWFPPANNLVRSEVRYMDGSQKEQIVNIPADEAESICPGLVNNKFEVRSFFLPEPDAVDTFAIDWQALNPLYRIARDKWEIIYCNSWHGMPKVEGNKEAPQLMIDGDFNTFWHTRYLTYAAGDNPLDPNLKRDPPPFTFVIDLGEEIEIMQVDLYRRMKNNNTQTVIAYASADDEHITDEDIKWRGTVPVPPYASNHSFFPGYSYEGVENNRWVELGRVEYPADSNLDTPEKNLQSIDASKLNIKSRYLKIILPNTRSNGNASLSEVFISTH